MIRLLYVIYRSSHPLYCRPPGPFSAMIVLGSEMLNLLAALQIDRFKPRYYIAAATDNMSLEKAKVLENSLLEKEEVEVGETSHFLQIYRSHEVGLLYITSVGTNVDCFNSCVVANDQDQTSCDSMQWTQTLYTALCNCILFQGFWDPMVIRFLC